MNNELIKIQVSGIRDAQNSIGALVDLIFNEQGDCSSASRLIWFPKSQCVLKEEEYPKNHFGRIIDSKIYHIFAPKWFLDKNNITYKIL